MRLLHPRELALGLGAGVGIGFVCQPHVMHAWEVFRELVADGSNASTGGVKPKGKPSGSGKPKVVPPPIYGVFYS